MSSSILDMSTSPTTAPAPCLSSGATRRSSRRRRTLVPKDDASFSSSSSSSPSSSDPSDDDDEDYLDDDGVAIDPKRRRQRKTRKRVDGRVWPSQCDVADCRVTLRDQPAYRLHHRRYHRGSSQDLCPMHLFPQYATRERERDTIVDAYYSACVVYSPRRHFLYLQEMFPAILDQACAQSALSVSQRCRVSAVCVRLASLWEALRGRSQSDSACRVPA